MGAEVHKGHGVDDQVSIFECGAVSQIPVKNMEWSSCLRSVAKDAASIDFEVGRGLPDITRGS